MEGYVHRVGVRVTKAVAVAVAQTCQLGGIEKVERAIDT
jgi:hypothetical protein